MSLPATWGERNIKTAEMDPNTVLLVESCGNHRTNCSLFERVMCIYQTGFSILEKESCTTKGEPISSVSVLARESRVDKCIGCITPRVPQIKQTTWSFIKSSKRCRTFLLNARPLCIDTWDTPSGSSGRTRARLPRENLRLTFLNGNCLLGMPWGPRKLYNVQSTTQSE